MTPEQRYVYTEELNIHAHLALSSFEVFHSIVTHPQEKQRREAWMHLQSFLSHFGMVSKLLYAPSAYSKESKARALELRDYLETDKSSALNNRDARNALEHLDERMDNWLKHEGKGFLESVFDKRSEYDFFDKDRWLVRRVYLVEEEIFITQESGGPKEMDIRPLVDELKRIKDVTYEKLSSDNSYHIIHPR